MVVFYWGNHGSQSVVLAPQLAGCSTNQQREEHEHNPFRQSERMEKEYCELKKDMWLQMLSITWSRSYIYDNCTNYRKWLNVKWCIDGITTYISSFPEWRQTWFSLELRYNKTHTQPHTHIHTHTYLICVWGDYQTAEVGCQWGGKEYKWCSRFPITLSEWKMEGGGCMGWGRAQMLSRQDKKHPFDLLPSALI